MKSNRAGAGGCRVVTPGSERVVRGEGMPISKLPGQRGNLRQHFDVQVSALFGQHCSGGD